MRAVLSAVSPEWLEERRRLGIDGRDEVWDGELHVPPPASWDHMWIEPRLWQVLQPLAEAIGLTVATEVGLLDPTAGWDNYRVPDVVVVEPARTSKRGVEGRAEIVIELLSPGEEARTKLPFYASQDVQEIWLIDVATRALEVYVLRGGAYFAVTPDRTGMVLAPRLGLALRVVDGPKLRIEWSDGSAEI